MSSHFFPKNYVSRRTLIVCNKKSNTLPLDEKFNKININKLKKNHKTLDLSLENSNVRHKSLNMEKSR